MVDERQLPKGVGLLEDREVLRRIAVPHVGPELARLDDEKGRPVVSLPQDHVVLLVPHVLDQFGDLYEFQAVQILEQAHLLEDRYLLHGLS